MKTLDDYERVDESRVRTQASITGSKNLRRLLEIADEWRAAGCTPVFIIYQEEPTILACVSEETFARHLI